VLYELSCFGNLQPFFQEKQNLLNYWETLTGRQHKVSVVWAKMSDVCPEVRAFPDVLMGANYLLDCLSLLRHDELFDLPFRVPAASCCLRDCLKSRVAGRGAEQPKRSVRLC